MYGLWIGIAVIGIGFLWLMTSYNRLVALREQARAAWAQIDVFLKRRYDLIPNMVETVKGYAAHERGTLEAVIAARNQAVNATTPSAKVAAEGQVQSTLGRLFALAESYPELKANANFVQLQNELADTENQIAGVRSGYNRSIQAYNTAIHSIPSNIIASIFNFDEMPLFEIQVAAEREAPKVKFS